MTLCRDPATQLNQERIDLADGKTCCHLLVQRYDVLLEQIATKLTSSFAIIHHDAMPLMAELVGALKQGVELIENSEHSHEATSMAIARVTAFMNDFEKLTESYTRLLVPDQP